MQNENLNKTDFKNNSKNKTQNSAYTNKKTFKAKPSKVKDNKSAMTAHKKMQLLFTVVNREKTDFYVDLLNDFEVNLQMILSARGTANDHIISLLGLTDSDKSVIISAIRKDRAKDALSLLEEKFSTVRGGKGIAYTVPISSTIGVAIYQFLSNTTNGGIR